MDREMEQRFSPLDPENDSEVQGEFIRRDGLLHVFGGLHLFLPYNSDLPDPWPKQVSKFERKLLRRPTHIFQIQSSKNWEVFHHGASGEQKQISQILQIRVFFGSNFDRPKNDWWRYWVFCRPDWMEEPSYLWSITVPRELHRVRGSQLEAAHAFWPEETVRVFDLRPPEGVLHEPGACWQGGFPA